MTSVLKNLIFAFDAINHILGQILRWLTLAMALTVCVLVVARAAFDVGSIAAQESVTYMHGIVFMLCLAYTAQADGHVRVDIFYRRLTTHQKAWINVVGHCVFLLPFALFLTAISIQYVLQAWGWQHANGTWGSKEVSADPGGLPLVFLLKTILPLTGMSLALHAMADIVRQLLRLTFVEPSTKEHTINAKPSKHNEPTTIVSHEVQS